MAFDGLYRLYLGPAYVWQSSRFNAVPFDSREEAEKVAFDAVLKSPDLLGKVYVDRLWCEPPEIAGYPIT